CQHGYGTPFTF
nr:immunoglobulin light chain junction region [Macaca mulatta]MOV74400.1 immunoglobulin light chain junction region [Macaca mulatta]MOV74517.1 immunoglobulin light chain junction region [Macaca mulatta]MOV74886.1 immunoglobulin light chain junction region [Macaca mulatta]MOV75674.1 immunoglobulin light chain junction region [Macaca mulatta]